MFSAQYQTRIIPMPDDDDWLSQARRRGCRAFARHDGKHRSVVLNEIWYYTWALNDEEWGARLRQAYGKIGNDGSGIRAEVSCGTRLFGG
jgi:hypothetical protein